VVVRAKQNSSEKLYWRSIGKNDKVKLNFLGRFVFDDSFFVVWFDFENEIAKKFLHSRLVT